VTGYTQQMNCSSGQILRTAVDGKYIRMRKTNESGSPFFNCKNFFSSLLTAVADADYCFISADVGAYGSWSDSNVFYTRHWEKDGRVIN